MRKLLLTAAVCLLPLTPAFAQPLTLRDAAAEALERNPALLAAQAEVRAARARRDEARASWFPLIDASANASRSNNPVFVFGSLLEQGRFSEQHFSPAFLNDPPALRNDRLSLTVRYTLFDQLRRRDMTKQGAEGVTRALSAGDEMRQQVLSELIARYYGVLVAEQRHAVSAEAVRAAESAAKNARDRAEQGLAVDSDRLAAEVQLAEFRQQEIAAAGAAEIARAALAMTLGRPLLSRVELVASFPDVRFDPVALEDAVKRASESRGELASAIAARKSAELQLVTARGSLLPRVDAYSSWGASGTTFSQRNPDHTVGVIASIDVFDAAKYARIAEARAGVEAAKALEASIRDRVAMEAITAWNKANAARQQVEVASSAVAQADAAARIIQDRYDNGLTTITEVLRAQTALVAARLSLLSARQQSISGHAELLRSIGGLREIDPF